METEVITPEVEAVEKMEAKDLTGGQPAVLSKASLGELQEVEDAHSKHAGIVENSMSTEELLTTQSLTNGVKKHNNEGQNGNSGTDSFLESPSLAGKHSDESLGVSQEIEDKDTPVLMHTEGLENGSEIQKDQTGQIVEVTSDVTEDNTTSVNGKQAEMRINDARDVFKEQNDYVNVRENLHTVPTTSSSGDLDQQEGKAEDGSEAVIHNIEQKSDAFFDDKQSTIVGNSVEVMAVQKGEDEAVSTLQIDTREGEIPIPENPPRLQEEEIETKEKSTILDSTVEGHETIYPTDHDLGSLPEKMSSDHQTGEAENDFPTIEDKESKYSKVEEEWSPRNTSVAPIDSQEERGAENAIEPETQDKNINLIEKDDIKEEKVPEQPKVDKAEIEQNDIEEPAPEKMHKDLDYPSAKQVQKGPEKVESHDEGQSDIKEKDCSVKDLTPVSNGEQEDNEIVKENDVAENPKEEEVNEERLVAPNEHNGQQNKEEIKIQELSIEASEVKNGVTEELENVGPEKETGEHVEEDIVPEYSKTSIVKETEDGLEKEKANEGQENIGMDKDIGQPILEEAVDLDHTTMNNVEEPIKNDQEEEKVTEGLEVVGQDKDINIEKHIIDDDVVEDHSKAPNNKEPLKDGHSEEETRELAIDSSDKDIKEPTVEEDIVNNSTEIIEEEPLEDDCDKNKVTGGSQLVGAEDTGENILEEGVLPAHLENSTVEKPFEGGHEEEAIEELETMSANQDITEPMGEGVVVPNYSTTKIEDEQVRDGHAESEVIGESELLGKEYTGDTTMEKGDGIYRPETEIKEPTIEGHIEEKKTEELEIAGVDNSTVEPIAEEVRPNHSASISPVASVLESCEENVKDNGETINAEDIVQDTYKINTEDEQIKEKYNGDKAINESEIPAADKEIREPIIREHVADNYTTTIEDSQEESKETGGSESLENVEETIVLNDIVPDHSETTIKDEAIKDGVKDEKEPEETDIAAVDKSLSEPITEEVVPDHSSTITNDESVEDSQEEKVSGCSELAGTDKDIQSTVKEEEDVPSYSETTTVDKQASHNGYKLNEDQEISVEDKSIVEPITKEVVSDYFTTINEDGHEEIKVSGDLQVANDEAVEETRIGKDTVPAYSEITVKDELIKDVDDEVKASEGADIVGEEKSIGEPITEEVALNHTAYISGDEPAEDSHEEKVSGALGIAVVDKGIGDNVKEKDVFTDHIETPITEEQNKEVHNEEKVTEELEISSVSKDIEKPLTEEAAFPEYITTITEDDPEESKVNGESQTTGTENMREAITEKEISLENSEANTREEPITDGHEEEKINEELETASADDTTRNPILEEVGTDHSGTIIENDSKKDSIEENKVAEESQIVGEDKNIEETPCNSETAVGEDINQEHNEKEKNIEEIEKDSADKEITEPITEEAIVPTCSTTIIEDEPIEAAPLIQVIQEREIDDASITGLPAISGSDETTKEDSQEDKIDISKHEVEAKESDLSMAPAAEEQDSTAKVKRVDLVEEESEHMNHDADDVLEIREEEKAPNKISEDNSHTANELNYEAADKTEEIEKVHSKDGEDLHEIHETDENKETTEEEEMHNESSEMLGETSSLAPFVSEEQTNKEIVEEEKSRNMETVESNDSNITQQLLEDSKIADAKPEEKDHGEDGGIPKEEVHNVEFREMNQEPEIATSQTQEEKTIDEETSLTQKGETESIKLEETDETDSTELVGQRNIELKPTREDQDELYPSIVKHGTVISAENEEVCAEPAVAALTENTESEKERSPILEDVTSVHDVKETIGVSREEEKDGASNPSGEISKILEVSGASRDIKELGIEEKEEEHVTVQEAIGDKSIEEQTTKLPAESGTDSLEGKLSKENSQQDEVYEELESVAAKDDSENLTMDTEQTKVGSQEDGGIETQGEEAEDSGSVSAMVATNSTDEREILLLEEEKDPKKSHDAFIATETLLEENKSTERGTEIDNSTKSLVSEEQDIDEVPEKTMSTSNNHESDSSTSLTEKLSLSDAELEPEVGELVDHSDISSKEIFSAATEGNNANPRDSTMEDVERKEDNTTDNILVAETLVVDEVEHKQSQTQEETSDDISEKEPQETSTLVSDKHESDKTKMKEKTQDRSILEDEIEDKMEAPLVSETNGDENFEVEGYVKLDEDAEVEVEGTEQKISISESEPTQLVSEPQVGGVVLDSEESIQTKEFRDDNILEASELDATKTGINKETYGLEQNATLAQNAEAVDPCEDFPEDIESADQDQSPEVLPETEKTTFIKDGEIINEQDAVSAEDHTVDESIQEKTKENNNLEGEDTYLDAEDEKLEAMSFEKPSDLASQFPTFNNENTDQESGLVEKNVELETYLSAGDQKLDELMTPDKSSDLVPQIPTLNNEKIDQGSGVVDKNVEDIIESDMPVENIEESSKKNVEDIIESDIPVKNTEECSEKNREDIIESDIPVKNTKESSEKNMEDIIESDIPVKSIEESSEKNVEDIIESDISVRNTESSENDQKNVEASIPRELIETTELAYQENTNDNITIAPSLGEETSIGYVGDANAEEILQEGKEEDVIKKSICESKDDETNKSNEGTLADEVPKYLENASDIQNDERQSLGETNAPKESVQELSGDNANLASLKESEEKGDNVDEEAAMLVNDEQFTVSNAEKSKVDDTYEANAPEDSILNQEVPEGSEDTFAGHKIGEQMIEEEVKEEPNLVAASKESIQLTRQGEDVEGEGAEEVSTTSEPEKIYPEKDSLTDESSNANETSKNEVAHEMLTSHEVVFVEEEVLTQEDFRGRPVTSIVNSDQNVPSEETPIQVSKHLEEESVNAQEELTRETLSKASDAEGRIPTDPSETESFSGMGKHADSVSVAMPMSVKEISPTEEEIPTDNASVSSLTEASREQIQEKEGNCAEDEEKQEMAYTKKGTNEESGEDIELKIPLVQTLEGTKTNELNLQKKSCANEEGEPQLSMLPVTSDAPGPEKISIEAEPIQETEEKSSGSSTDVSSLSISVIEKSLQEDGIDDMKHGQALGHDSQVNDAKYNKDREMNSSNETNTDVKSSEGGVSSSDMINKSSNESLQSAEQSEEGNPPHYKRLESNKALTIEIKDTEKTDQKEKEKEKEKEKDEEGEEDEDDNNEEHKKDDSGSDAPVMVEASKDIDMKTTPKKSHGILHGVGSKVKHSISKVKKAITGKSSPHKQSSPKS